MPKDNKKINKTTTLTKRIVENNIQMYKRRTRAIPYMLIFAGIIAIFLNQFILGLLIILFSAMGASILSREKF